MMIIDDKSFIYIVIFYKIAVFCYCHFYDNGKMIYDRSKELSVSEPLFPVGLVISEEYLTYESMREYEVKWDVQSFELEDGSFYSTLQGVHTPKIQLAVRFYSKAMMLTGTHPKGSVLLYIIKSDEAVVNNDRITPYNELVVRLENEQVEVLTNASSHVYMLSVESHLLYRLFYKYFDVLFEDYIRDHALLIVPEKMDALFTGLEAWVTYLSTENLKPTFESRYDAVESEIVQFIFDHLICEKKASKRNKFDVSKVKKRLEKSLTATVDMKGLSQEFNISERQLFNAFKSTYGITPKKFLQGLRLNAVRQELLASKKGQVKISEVAFKYGFHHLSHFTNEYKKLFGCTPSSTLEKSAYSE